MTLKRKRSSTQLSSSPTSISTHDRTPFHLPSRTLKRTRPDAPELDAIHMQTLALMADGARDAASAKKYGSDNQPARYSAFNFLRAAKTPGFHVRPKYPMDIAEMLGEPDEDEEEEDEDDGWVDSFATQRIDHKRADDQKSLHAFWGPTVTKEEKTKYECDNFMDLDAEQVERGERKEKNWVGGLGWM
ncbi:MAG: hypothetical protein M1814_002513 [Vezdaea aestivalis]|nr:MAG: hypothetical protein M1814_002513 [Vezdaea aestivalis]